MKDKRFCRYLSLAFKKQKIRRKDRVLIDFEDVYSIRYYLKRIVNVSKSE